MYLLINLHVTLLKTGWKEAYCINPADIKRFLNRWRDEKLHRRKMAEYDRLSEKEGRRKYICSEEFINLTYFSSMPDF